MKTSAVRRTHPLIRRVALHMQSRTLIAPGSGVLVAVSGGPDSVCLLAVLEELWKGKQLSGVALRIAHMNYGLRGTESDEDAAFVQELGERFGIPVSCARTQLVHRHRESLQAEAREKRYAFFEQLCHTYGLSIVATGHTAEDQAETLLMWLLRGSGTTGLAGIPLVREGKIIRPLLHERRAEVLSYLASRGLSYRVDRSNATSAYRRNRIRHELVPQLQVFNPRILEALVRTADILAEDAATLDDLEQHRWNDVARESGSDSVVLDAARLAAYPLSLQRRLIRRAWMRVRGKGVMLQFRHVEDVIAKVLRGKVGSSLDLPDGLCAYAKGGSLIIGRRQRAARDARASWASGVTLQLPGEVLLDSKRKLLAEMAGTACPPMRDRSTCAINTEQTGQRLLVRSWQPGDWFCPSGMGGRRKKLQDFFVDAKVPRSQRGQVPVVVGPSGIVWVVGYRADDRFRARTWSRQVVILSLTEGEEGERNLR